MAPILAPFSSPALTSSEKDVNLFGKESIKQFTETKVDSRSGFTATAGSAAAAATAAATAAISIERQRLNVKD